MSALGTMVTYHPFKLLFTLAYLSLNAVRLPLWILLYSIPSFRPNANWSLKQAVRVRILRAVLYNMSTVEMQTTLSLVPGREKERFIVTSPAKEAFYVDAVSCDPEVRPGPVGVTWYPRVPSGAEIAALRSGSSVVVLHFHGGAYAIGDGRTQDAGFASKTMIAHSDAAFVACPQYRLASNARCRFPAQLQDAVTSYAYLTHELGIPANRVVLSGDSAGANLTLGLVRYLTHHGAAVDLDPPRAAWLWSLWAHPATSALYGVDAMSRVPNGQVDYVGGAFGLWGARRLTPSPTSGHGIDSPYISFVDAPFATPVPLYFSAGECEALLTDDVKVAEQFENIKGNVVKLQIEEHSVHDVILAAPLIGFEEEAVQAAKRAGDWLRTIAPAQSKL